MNIQSKNEKGEACSVDGWARNLYAVPIKKFNGNYVDTVWMIVILKYILEEYVVEMRTEFIDQMIQLYMFKRFIAI